MTRWYEERKKEGYYRAAKREGYRARSAYKLKQINDKHRVIREGDAVADLGCAPGGWSQVLVEIVGTRGEVVGVDLQRVRPLPGARFIQGDFTKPETRARLDALLAESGRSALDCVVSDMAPDMTGEYDLDQARSVYLSSLALDFAVAHLRKGGCFVCKVFEGLDYQEFRENVRQQFSRVIQFHPPASRKSSSEIYLIAKGFQGEGRAPDPKPTIARGDVELESSDSEE